MHHPFLAAIVWTIATLGTTCALLHLFPRLGTPGKAISRWLCYAPGLDLVVTILTVLPLIAGPAIWGWWGLLGGLLGQFVTLFGWTLLHELANRGKGNGVRMYRVHNRVIGFARNMTALVVTTGAVPTFWIVRMTELLVYPALVVLTRFPSYRQRDWVNVTRHKFDGLVGHDRIWCLYCDWMTGVWSLGTEMLRNIESFWCPIRFQDPAKCANCVIDFPDIDGGWTRENGNVQDAHDTLVHFYEQEPKPKSNAWFGHPVRLTVKGKSLGDDSETV